MHLFGDSELNLTQNQLVDLLCKVSDDLCILEKTAFGKCFPYYNTGEKNSGLRISCSCENKTQEGNESNRLTIVNYIRIISNNSLKERYVNIVDFRGCDYDNKMNFPEDKMYWENSNLENNHDDDDDELNKNKYENQRLKHLNSFSWAVDNIQIDSLDKNTLLDCYKDLELIGMQMGYSSYDYSTLESHLKGFKASEIDEIERQSKEENGLCLIKYLCNISALCCLSFDSCYRTKSVCDLKDKYWNSDLFNEFEKGLDKKVNNQNSGFCIECVLIRKLIWKLRKTESKNELLYYKTFIAVLSACTDVFGPNGSGYLARDDEEKNPSKQQLKENMDLITEYVNKHFTELFLDHIDEEKEEKIENWKTIINVLHYSCDILSKYLYENDDKTEHDFSGLRNQYLDSLCKKLYEGINALQGSKKIKRNDVTINNLVKMVDTVGVGYVKKDDEEAQESQDFLALKKYVDGLKKPAEKEKKTAEEKNNNSNGEQKENKELNSSQKVINQNKTKEEKGTKRK